MGSAGELVTRRVLRRAGDGYEPGQYEARIIDPRPHRDRADLAAILTYVDDEGRACSVTCLRYRPARDWRPISLHRATLRHMERSTAAGCPELAGMLLETLELAAADAAPYPYEDPSPDEARLRRATRALLARVRSSTTEGKTP